MITAKNLSFSHGHGPIFDNISFTVGKGLKVGLVGPNGAGKSTLLKLILEEEFPQEGKINTFGKIGYVPQEVKRDKNIDEAETIKDFVDPENKKEEYILKNMLYGLEMQELDLSSPPQKLSGGQKTKLSLMRALIEEPDILLLDEPTNFLDTDGKKWIMDFLGNYEKTLLIISHDLALLDAHISKVIAIDPFSKKIEEFGGNYTHYTKVKKEHDELLKRKVLNEQKHIKQMKKGLERMARYKSEKGVRARTNLKRRIERLEAALPDLPPEIKRIRLELPEPIPTGEIPLKVSRITKIYNDEVVLADVSFSIYKNERVALIGPNGAGKSTLIKIIMGITDATEGTIEKDQHLSIGYYSQEFETFNFDLTVLQTVEEVSPMPEAKIRPFLARFNFPSSRVSQKIGTLSGGEKTRLFIALLMLQNHNLLILDEPTTYLDVFSQRIILDSLKMYKGALFFVSHTEEFVKEMKPNRALLLPENRIEYWIEELAEKVSIIEE